VQRAGTGGAGVGAAGAYMPTTLPLALHLRPGRDAQGRL